MKSIAMFSIAATLSVVAAPALAERWSVTEGPRGEWKGTWTLEASRSDFSIVLKYGATTFTAEGNYVRNGNSISISRTNSSDGNDCNYTGTISGKSVSGTYYCKTGGPYSWSAVISSD